MSNSNLPKKLADLRQKYGYTQIYIGKYLNTTRQGYAHYEHGTRNPDSQTLLKLATLYDVSMEDLLSSKDNDTITFTREEDSYSTDDSQHFHLPKHEQHEFIDLLSQLSQTQLEDYKSMLRVTVQNNNLRKKKR